MAKIKHTKNELKAQRDALARYQRFLPMLQLKKQQLQMEIHQVDARLAERTERQLQQQEALSSWVGVLAGPDDIGKWVWLERVELEPGNIAGVSIPLFKDVVVERKDVDLFETPTWVDDAIQVLEGLIRLHVEREILLEQRRLIAEELRTTSQRVNLFELVKIPECRENIRVIKIFLGDEQTASVVRGKIAKRLTMAME